MFGGVSPASALPYLSLGKVTLSPARPTDAEIKQVKLSVNSKTLEGCSVGHSCCHLRGRQAPSLFPVGTSSWHSHSIHAQGLCAAPRLAHGPQTVSGRAALGSRAVC